MVVDEPGAPTLGPTMEDREEMQDREEKMAPSKTLTDRQIAEIEALANLPDDRIDTSDTPEILDWSDARRGLLHRPPTQA